MSDDSPQDTIGRDALISELWRVLNRQSVVLTAERRLGKTSILKKMEAQPQEGWLPIYRDLEQIHTPVEFVEKVFHDAEAYLGRWERAALRVRELLGHLQGAEIGKLVKFPAQAEQSWKQLLSRIMEDLFDERARAPDRRIVF